MIKDKRIKLEHFYSDWNGQKSAVPYHRKPTQSELRLAKQFDKERADDGLLIFWGERVVEVRGSVSNGVSGNHYRDMYRVVTK